MKTNNLLKILLLMMFSYNFSAFSAEIRVSSQQGSSYDKLRSAISQAQSGDIVILDQDVNYENNNGTITIARNNITIRGAARNNGKYKIIGQLGRRTLLTITATNFAIFNTELTNGSRQIEFRLTGNQVSTRTRIINCIFRNASFVGVNFRESRFQNVVVRNTRFINTLFGLQSFDCPVLQDFRVIDCTFTGGDHQISLDNPLATIENHRNIRIVRSVFNVAARFNIALANTRNVVIVDCTMFGGTQAYSQCLHIEDRSSNITARNNTMTNDADVAVLSHTTGRIGHGQGRRLTDAERVQYGSSNIILDGNTITSGTVDAAVFVSFGRGFFRILENNVIRSGNRGIASVRSANTVDFQIADNLIVKGKRYGAIRADTNVMRRESFVRIR